MIVQEILESHQAEIDKQVRDWLSEYLDKLEHSSVMIHERGEDRGDHSGRLVDAAFADFANPEMTLESCLQFTRSGMSRATYCSGMGLTYDTSLDEFGEHVSEVMFSNAGERPDDDDEWMQTVHAWIVDTFDEFLKDVELCKRFQDILDYLTEIEG